MFGVEENKKNIFALNFYFNSADLSLFVLSRLLQV